MKTTTAYIFDNNFYFNGTCLVQADPKSEEWLIPSDCTLTKPELKAGYFYKFNENEWQAEKIPLTCDECLGIEIKHTDNNLHSNFLRDLFKKLTDENQEYELKFDDNLTLSVIKKEQKIKTLEELKAEKLNELDQKSSAFEQTENKLMYVVSSLGFKVNADPKALRNIDVLISQKVKQFKVYDNTIKSVTVNDLKIIKSEIEQNALNLYHQKWEYQDMINNANSLEELNQIDIDFKMLDFTEVSDELSDEVSA